MTWIPQKWFPTKKKRIRVSLFYLYMIIYTDSDSRDYYISNFFNLKNETLLRFVSEKKHATQIKAQDIKGAVSGRKLIKIMTLQSMSQPWE